MLKGAPHLGVAPEVILPQTPVGDLLFLSRDGNLNGEVLSTFLSGARGASRRQSSPLSQRLVAPRRSSWHWSPLSEGRVPVLSLRTSKHMHCHPALPAATLLPACPPPYA